MKSILGLFLSACLLCPALAADFGAYQLDLPSKDLISGPELYINHRFFGPIDYRAAETMFGTELGANMSIGFGFPLSDRLEASLFRSVLHRSFQLSAKYKLCDQGSLFLGAVGKTANGITRNKNNVVIGSVFALPVKAAILSIVPSVVIADDTSYTVGLNANFPLREDLQSMIEYIPSFSSQNSRYPVISAGIKYRIAVHYFTLMLTNTTYSSFDEVIRGSTDNVFHLGFNIVVMF